RRRREPHAQYRLSPLRQAVESRSMSDALPIENDVRFRISTATDGQTDFAVPFPFQANADIAVVKLVDGVQTLLAEAEDYILTGAGEAAGGTVTLNEPAEAGW